MRSNANPVAIMFTDVVGSTALTERLGDHVANELIQRHIARARR